MFEKRILQYPFPRPSFSVDDSADGDEALDDVPDVDVEVVADEVAVLLMG